MANVTQFNSAGLATVFWAMNNSAGYPCGTAGTLSNGADASMARLIGVESFSLPLQEPRQASIPGDDDIQAIYLFPPETLPNGDIVLGNIDLTFWAKQQGMVVYADGEYSGVVGQPDQPTYGNMTFIVNAQAKSAQSGSVGNPGYRVKVYPKVQAVPIGDAGQQAATATKFTHKLIANKSDKLPWGESFTVANHGTTRAAVYEYYSDYRHVLHTHIGDGSDTSFTLGYTPAAATAGKIQLWKDGVLKTITTDWSVSGSVITEAAAPAAAAVVVARVAYSS